MNGNGGRWDAALRIHQLVKTLLTQELAVDDANGPHLDDFVAL